jgi:hypothetical protein
MGLLMLHQMVLQPCMDLPLQAFMKRGSEPPNREILYWNRLIIKMATATNETLRRCLRELAHHRKIVLPRIKRLSTLSLVKKMFSKINV